MSQQRRETSERTVGLAFPTRNDLPANVREPMVGMLNRSLADTTDLLTQAKFAHWNVRGQNFYQLHLLFDELAETLGEHQDLLAERATALGGQALGTVRMAAATSTIPEIAVDAVAGEEFLRALADNLAVHAANLREDVDTADWYGDEDTMDLFIEVSRDVDKHLWFLDAHLGTRPVGSGDGTANAGGSRTESRSVPAPGQERQQPTTRPNGGRRYGRRSAEEAGIADRWTPGP